MFSLRAFLENFFELIERIDVFLAAEAASDFNRLSCGENLIFFFSAEPLQNRQPLFMRARAAKEDVLLARCFAVDSF